MNIVISNIEFEFNLGCKILKIKHKECPYKELEDIWDSIEPITFKEIAELKNIEHRRVAFLLYGLDNLIKEVDPVLVNKKIINKTTTWLDNNNNPITKTFEDVYELYQVNGSYFGKTQWGRFADDVYYIKCKDTSTNREYMIWVDVNNVYRTKYPEDKIWSFDSIDINKIDAIDCIAWTIQTDVPKENINKIIRQGDCILINTKNKYTPLVTPRHLTSQEYLNLLVAES